jgi:hypothetical protein
MGQPKFSTDDQQARFYIDQLMIGSEEEKYIARSQLAIIFEQRGMFEEAIELLTTNDSTKPNDVNTLRFLSRLYRESGEIELEEDSNRKIKDILNIKPPIRTRRENDHISHEKTNLTKLNKFSYKTPLLISVILSAIYIMFDIGGIPSNINPTTIAVVLGKFVGSFIPTSIIAMVLAVPVWMLARLLKTQWHFQTAWFGTQALLLLVLIFGKILGISR